MVKMTIGEANKRLSQFGAVDLEVNDKLSHAAKRNIERITSAMKPYSRKFSADLEDIDYDFAATDKNDHIIRDEKGKFVFTRDKGKERLKAIRKLEAEYEAIEIGFEPYFAKPCERMMDLDLFLVEELTGILFKPSEVNPENTDQP